MEGFRLTLEEIAGSVGNFGTVLPFALGVALVSPVNLGTILLFFGIWYIISGIIYRIPIPVEPMKAIGAIVIAGGLGAGEIAASGIICGVLFLAIGLGRGMHAVQKFIPVSVIRGIQLGLALILLRTAAGLMAGDLLISGISIAVILAFFAVTTIRKGIPDLSALIVIGIGIVTGIAVSGIPPIQLMALPSLVVPAALDAGTAAWRLVLPQIPLTLANAILATALLTHDFFKRDLKPDNLSTTIGVMNLVSAPFGGFPMCHGAGGLAAHYRFGARTGTSMVIGGIFLITVALFFSAPATVGIIPVGIFGALLVFIAIELSKHAVRTDEALVTASMAILALAAGMTVAFIWGLALAYAISRFRGRKGAKTS
ncbi:MAG: putative sulfate/molybdate transporter [Methanomicrobiaceae archaeon]|nr:putative sulfate/molybdate transporter [Methanomicrobiaceae archaeon]